VAPRIAKVWSFRISSIALRAFPLQKGTGREVPQAGPVPNADTRDNLLAFAQPADREKLKLHRISEIHLLLNSCPVGIDGCES
jgi:hypothetical protein